MKEFDPLISTITGGMLAILGGVVSAILIQKYISGRENRKILIKKSEEVYKMVLKLDHFTHCTGNIVMYDSMKGKAPDDVSLSQYEYQQIKMLVGLYFPTLKEVANQYVAKREEHLLLFMKYLRAFVKEEKLPTTEEIEAMSVIQKDYDNNSNFFKGSLIQSIGN